VWDLRIHSPSFALVPDHETFGQSISDAGMAHGHLMYKADTTYMDMNTGDDHGSGDTGFGSPPKKDGTTKMSVARHRKLDL